MATWCEELTHLKRPWCWERLRAGGEGDNRGWDGWMASLTQWTWVWVDSGSWWWTGRPGMLQSMGLQIVRHDWVNELNWTSKAIWSWSFPCSVIVDYSFTLLTSNWPVQIFLFPPDSVFIGYMFLRIFPFLLGCPVCWCLVFYSSPYDPWAGKIPWRRKWQPTPVFLPGKSHGQRSLVGYSPWGRKESDTTKRLHFHFLSFFLSFLWSLVFLWYQL